jgi:hypothetical protein
MGRPTANKFITGLQDVDDYCRQHFNQPLYRCRTEDRQSTLAYFEKRDPPWSGMAGKIQARLLGTPFFTTMKSCTAIAYCTSEKGATKGLSYVLIPGSFHGCIPKLPGQKAWATK